MKNTNNEFIISEHERLRYLSKSTRKLLMNVLMAFIRDEFHNQPTKAEISSLCHATINIFPSLKSENGVQGGIVRNAIVFRFPSFTLSVKFRIFTLQDILYNPEKKSGFLYDKLCKLGSREIAARISIAETEKTRLITFFTNCKLPNDKKEIMIELEKTALDRRKLVRDPTSKFPKVFPFHIVDPYLVSEYFFGKCSQIY